MALVEVISASYNHIPGQALAETGFRYDSVTLRVEDLFFDEIPGHRVAITVERSPQPITVQQPKRALDFPPTRVVVVVVGPNIIMETLTRPSGTYLIFPIPFAVMWTRKD